MARGSRTDSMKRKNKMDNIAILNPCYNEAKTIEKVVRDWRASLPEAVNYVDDTN